MRHRDSTHDSLTAKHFVSVGRRSNEISVPVVSAGSLANSSRTRSLWEKRSVLLPPVCACSAIMSLQRGWGILGAGIAAHGAPPTYGNRPGTTGIAAHRAPPTYGSRSRTWLLNVGGAPCAAIPPLLCYSIGLPCCVRISTTVGYVNCGWWDSSFGASLIRACQGLLRGWNFWTMRDPIPVARTRQG